MLMNLSKLKQNRKLLAAGAVILVVIVAAAAGIGYHVLSSRNNAVVNFSNPDGSSSAPAVQAISAKDVGLVITVRPDNLAVKFKLNNASDIKHVDYEITYDHVLDGQTVEEGITGEMNIAQDGITVTDYRPFGTCSSGVCRYDAHISNVDLIMKIET